MLITGNSKEILRDTRASYLEIAEFIRFSGTEIESDLHQLWRRIVFNISISNTDDRLRNHGFLLSVIGWRLSLAHDINPSIDKLGLALNIDMDINALDFELAKSTGDYFMLDRKGIEEILMQIRVVVSDWRKYATSIGIPRHEQDRMQSSFIF
jgi:serine/threonine-protein kinase HipA